MMGRRKVKKREPSLCTYPVFIFLRSVVLKLMQNGKPKIFTPVGRLSWFVIPIPTYSNTVNKEQFTTDWNYLTSSPYPDEPVAGAWGFWTNLYQVALVITLSPHPTRIICYDATFC